MKREKIFLFVIFIATIFMSIGYATVNNVSLSILGLSSAADNGKVYINNVTLAGNNKLIQNQSSVTWTDESIKFNLKFEVTNNDLRNNAEFYARYKVELVNDTLSDYVFASNAFKPDVQTETNDKMTYAIDPPEGIEIGEVIPAKTTKTFYVRINIYPTEQGTYTFGGDSDINTNKDEEGSLIGSLTGETTGNLKSPNTSVEFTASVINSYKTGKTFTIGINNNNFRITDSNGNTISSFIIPAETTENYSFYIAKADNATFALETQKLNINLIPTDEVETSMGIVTLLVDQDTLLIDDVPPEVGNVTATLQPTIGSVLVSWTGSDNVGIDYYKVEVYNSSNTKIKEKVTDADETEITIDGLNDGNYYFKVIAYDQKGNTASAQNSSAEFKWHFTVKWVLTNASSTGSNNDTVAYGDSYEKTLSGTNDYDIPANVTIEMVGNDSPNYTYSANTGELKINNVTGNLTITASGRTGTCLVKGTKILLANGKYKNVEDIKYTDLLAVWSYDTGSVTYEYPLLIKNEKKGAGYYKISFSDNTYINIFGDHGFYNYDLKRIVAFKDKEHFKVGSNIAKIDKNGNFTKVKVTKIEEINEDVNYYFIASARYFNIIANDFITTYQGTTISNLYGFTDNAKWPIIKDLLLKNNIYDYDKFSDVLPYYMYKGFRVGEAGFLINHNIITLDEFKKFISQELMGDGIVKEHIKKNNKSYWIVTTSEDKVTEKNKNKFLVKEGSTYTLPKIKEVKSYYSTSENKYYRPGEKVKIYYSMHFIEIK